MSLFIKAISEGVRNKERKENIDIMITAKAIRNRIAEICSAVTWDYNGKHCGVDPYGIPTKKLQKTGSK